jgi:imidazolonepropionase-like amidohydrolase
MRLLSPVSVLALSATFVACAGAPSGSTSPTSTTTATTSTTTSTNANAPTTIKHVVVSHGRNCGSYVATTGADGTTTITLDVLENGRGPHVDAKVKLAKDGTIQSLEAKGHHTFGAKLDETFVREGDHVKWNSLEEHGERDVKGAAFFVPIAEMPGAYGMLTQALLAANGRIALLPAGEATMEKTTDATVKAGGQQKHVVGYSIVGLDFTPTHVWMNEDGSWFGYVSPWYSVVPEGWEAAIDPLVEVQKQIDRKREARIASEQQHTPKAAGLAYTHARVLDVEHGKWMKDQTVVVVGDTIQSVVPSAGAKIPKDAEVVDLAGKALLPGLWDMHSHIGDADGTLDIASGVTSARDVGNDPDELDDYKKRYDAGTAVGPHLYRFGFIEGRNEKAASSKVTAETADEAKAAVKLFHDRGYDGIKIYNSVKPELVPLLAKEAHAKGMLVTGHVPVHMLAHEAVTAGYDGIEHVNMLFLNFFATHDTDTRDTTRFTLVGDNAKGLDLKSKPVVDFIALLKEHKTVVDPTIDAFEDLFVGQQGKISPGLESLVARLPVQTSRWFLTGGLPMDTPEKVALYKASFEKLGAMVKALVEAKVHVVTGTDSFGGLMLHHELALYVRAGISPATALRLATIECARAMKVDKKTGSLAAGKIADMFVVDGDPLANIDDLAKVVSTMKGGIVFASAPLYASVGVKP